MFAAHWTVAAASPGLEWRLSIRLSADPAIPIPRSTALALLLLRRLSGSRVQRKTGQPSRLPCMQCRTRPIAKARIARWLETCPMSGEPVNGHRWMIGLDVRREPGALGKVREHELQAVTVAPGARSRNLASVLGSQLLQGIVNFAGVFVPAIRDFQVVRQALSSLPFLWPGLVWQCTRISRSGYTLPSCAHNASRMLPGDIGVCRIRIPTAS